MSVLPGSYRSSSLMKLFSGRASASVAWPSLSCARQSSPMSIRSFSYTGSFSAKKPASAPSPLHTTSRPTSLGPSSKPPASKSATLLPNNASRTPHFKAPPMPEVTHLRSRQPYSSDVNASRPLGSFRYEADTDTFSESFLPFQRGKVFELHPQASQYKAEIAGGLNYLLAPSRMAPLPRVMQFCRTFEKAWRSQSVAETAKLRIREGLKQAMLEARGHPTSLLLNTGHYCPNNREVSSAATGVYGIWLKHIEMSTMMNDIEREALLEDLLAVVRSGQESFPSVDLAIKAFTLLPDGSFNMPAFRDLKNALSMSPLEQVPSHFGRYPHAG